MSDYGGGKGWLHFGSAVPVMLVFSAAIYALAYSVRLDTPTVEGYIEESSREAELEEKQLSGAH